MNKRKIYIIYNIRIDAPEAQPPPPHQGLRGIGPLHPSDPAEISNAPVAYKCSSAWTTAAMIK